LVLLFSFQTVTMNDIVYYIVYTAKKVMFSLRIGNET